jgi:hypothetical protein
MDRLLHLGTVVWLAADFDAAYARANRTGGLYQARQEFYRRAHLSIDTSHLNIDAVVGRIVRHLRDRERAAESGGPVPEAPARADLSAGVGECREGDG